MAELDWLCRRRAGLAAREGGKPMRRTIAAVAAAMVLSGSALAQTSAKKDANEPKGREITVTGCLTRGSRPNTFHLSNMPDALGSQLAVGTKGEVPSVTYELVGGSDLTAHLGHKMEVTGKLDPKFRVDAEHESRTSVTTNPSDKKAPTAKVETTEDVEITMRRLYVKTAKMVGSACTK
jgi:hypothetical protein